MVLGTADFRAMLLDSGDDKITLAKTPSIRPGIRVPSTGDDAGLTQLEVLSWSSTRRSQHDRLASSCERDCQTRTSFNIGAVSGMGFFLSEADVLRRSPRERHPCRTRSAQIRTEWCAGTTPPRGCEHIGKNVASSVNSTIVASSPDRHSALGKPCGKLSGRQKSRSRGRPRDVPFYNSANVHGEDHRSDHNIILSR